MWLFGAVGAAIGAGIYLAWSARQADYTDIELDTGPVVKPEPEAPILQFDTILFDCPECHMPGEIATVVEYLNEEGEIETFYIVGCLGNHDMVAITDEWLRQSLNTDS